MAKSKKEVHQAASLGSCYSYYSLYGYVFLAVDYLVWPRRPIFLGAIMAHCIFPGSMVVLRCRK